MQHDQNEFRYGLADPREKQRDACGVGFIANIKGQRSHRVINDGLIMLHRMDHRGGRTADYETSDGSGLMAEIPHGIIKKDFLDRDINIGEEGTYGVAMVFLPKKPEATLICRQELERVIIDEGLEIIGWRDVPVNSEALGWLARDCEPKIMQLVVRSHSLNRVQLEWRLYISRRVAESRIIKDNPDFYIPSFSTRTIIYKGLLISERFKDYYLDLANPAYKSSFSLMHQRFSTNTLPAWRLAQPFRCIGHNGEINTLRGNINWMHAREGLISRSDLDEDLKKLESCLTQGASDSAILDNMIEFLVQAGRPLSKVLSMVIPEPWESRRDMPQALRDYYEYHSCLMEPWDGPAFIGFSDGTAVGAVLDRNGLRPGRYWITDDDFVVMGSEAGLLDIDPLQIVEKGRLQPGKMFLVDMQRAKIINNEEIKEGFSSAQPWGRWLKDNRLRLFDLPLKKAPAASYSPGDFQFQKRAYGYTREDTNVIIAPMAIDGKEPTGSMGNDTPLAVLSSKPQLLYSYFKQLFAQVTNPPIDAIRETVVTSLSSALGAEGNLLNESPEQCRLIKLKQPILTNQDMARLRSYKGKGFQQKTLPILFEVEDGVNGMQKSLDELCAKVEDLVSQGVTILILSDRGVSESKARIPALLASAAVHHHLMRIKQRTRISLVVESGEPREVHHYAVLFGFGVAAINPWLAFDIIDRRSVEDGFEGSEDREGLADHYIKAIGQGLLKIMSKMGISTLQSYRGAQIFEAVGLSSAFVDRYFTWTQTRIEGIGIDEVAKDVMSLHQSAVEEYHGSNNLPVGGHYAWRRDGEAHLHSPQMIASMQKSIFLNSREEFYNFCNTVDDQSRQLLTIRGLLKFKESKSVPLSEVEDVKSIVKRFTTGAMSFGSISREAHEMIAVGMNRIGGKSNSGEGGEDPARFIRDENGDLRRSAIKQVASGRFGVTSHYLVNADELQIKLAQGAKPGEGGQLPGHKVSPEIGAVRHSTPGVTLISPPPHHDIYSIEDLAQLIFDLKNANDRSRVSVKLVSSVGVGTIASGVAKAKADAILISGFEGGTGASPITSVKHAGVPWELGLAEAQQSLVDNGLRSRVVLQTDGQLRTPRDIAIAALLGAEEWGVGTGALISLGCIMMRKCHLNTCPVGIATQDPELRSRFKGKPEYLINYIFLLAEGLREVMASLGFRKVSDMVGRSDLLETAAVDHPKASKLDLSLILRSVGEKGNLCHSENQDHELEKTLDQKVLLKLAEPAFRGKFVREEVEIKNIDRSACTQLSAAISRQFGLSGLQENAIRIKFNGVAGQSFMAFGVKGIHSHVEGEVNDYCGKGLSGGRIVVTPPANANFTAESNVICGNVALYGATSGQLFVRGIAGERFAVRNSGAVAVVEGTGDHGCEYMTGGRVVILGQTGKNFAAGMSGGIAWVYDEDGCFHNRVNHELVELSRLSDEEDLEFVFKLLNQHMVYTESTKAADILDDWENGSRKFVRVMPTAYRLALESQVKLERVVEDGVMPLDALMAEQGGYHG